MDTHFDHENYRFNVVVYPDTEVPRRHLSAVDLDYIVDARYLLGCGGCCCGGNPHARKLQLRHMPKAGHTLRGGRGGRRGGQGRCGGGHAEDPVHLRGYPSGACTRGRGADGPRYGAGPDCAY